MMNAGQRYNISAIVTLHSCQKCYVVSGSSVPDMESTSTSVTMELSLLPSSTVHSYFLQPGADLDGQGCNKSEKHYTYLN